MKDGIVKLKWSPKFDGSILFSNYVLGCGFALCPETKKLSATTRKSLGFETLTSNPEEYAKEILKFLSFYGEK